MNGQEHAHRDKSDFNGEAFMLAKLSLGTKYDEQVQLSVAEKPQFNSLPE